MQLMWSCLMYLINNLNQMNIMFIKKVCVHHNKILPVQQLEKMQINPSYSNPWDQKVKGVLLKEKVNMY